LLAETQVKLAVYNCKNCGCMVIGKAGSKNPQGHSCFACYGTYERNDVATEMLEERYKE